MADIMDCDEHVERTPSVIGLLWSLIGKPAELHGAEHFPRRAPMKPCWPLKSQARLGVSPSWCRVDLYRHGLPAICASGAVDVKARHPVRFEGVWRHRAIIKCKANVPVIQSKGACGLIVKVYEHLDENVSASAHCGNGMAGVQTSGGEDMPRAL